MRWLICFVVWFVFVANTEAASVKPFQHETLYAKASSASKTLGQAPEIWLQVESSVQAQEGEWFGVVVKGKSTWLARSSVSWRAKNATKKPNQMKMPNCSVIKSRSVGSYSDGKLFRGVLMPTTPDVFQWNFRQQKIGGANRTHYGTCKTVVSIIKAAKNYRTANPQAPMVAVGDLGLKHGGEIDHHSTHENGLVVDVYYPRKDRLKMEPHTEAQVDKFLARQLAKAMLAQGAKKILVGPRSGIPIGKRVVTYPNHQDHMHIFF